MTEVIEVSSRKDLNDFIKFPLALHSKDSFYVHHLIRDIRKHFSDENPFFLHAEVRCFIATRDGKINGRIVSVVNQRHIEFHKEKAGFFGFFESIDDYQTAAALLDRVSDVLRKAGMAVMRGPTNFSTNEECGFLIKGFQNPPLLMTPYNPAYYNDMMDKYGLHKTKDLYAYILDVPEELPGKIHRVADIVSRRGVSVRHIDKKNFVRDMQIFKDVYNSAWGNNWGFIPLTDKELVYLGNNLKQIVVPELIMIAEKDGKPVGFMGMLPDFNFVLKHMNGKLSLPSIVKALYYSKKIKDLRMLLLGIKADYRNKGVDALLFREGFKGVKKGGYRRVEFSWILEDNIPVQRLVEMIGGRLYKKYRIYEKAL
jgi:GNAT superfamily N-acetyltransferase